MPVNVWCDGCGEHIARGVRYNAEKKKCGTYFTSDVFEFQMNCHLCGQRFIIKTDPENRDYEFVSGLHRKVETFDVKEIGTREFDDKEQALMRGKISKKSCTPTRTRSTSVSAASSARSGRRRSVEKRVRAPQDCRFACFRRVEATFERVEASRSSGNRRRKWLRSWRT